LIWQWQWFSVVIVVDLSSPLLGVTTLASATATAATATAAVAVAPIVYIARRPGQAVTCVILQVLLRKESPDQTNQTENADDAA
jgi:hypothetical protein